MTKFFLIIIIFLSKVITANEASKDIKIWAMQASKSILSFSYYDNETYWQKLRPIFTKQGWLIFNKELSNDTIKLIKDYELASMLNIEKSSIKLKKNQNNLWSISIHALINYYGEKKSISYPIVISMNINWDNKKINKFSSKIINQPVYKKIYPRGCNLRKFP
jgi:hypothetical protein